MSDEGKKIIGTILINEPLHAVARRPADKCHQFGIFVDEFQTFAAFQDFATLITRAPKMGITTTLAHHERYGQLAESPEIAGATAAIVNKVIFQVTPKDADDFAGEFAEAPPTETRREQELVISQNPVSDLLSRGHKNPEVLAFVNKYLRHIQYRREDIKEDMEGERWKRLMYLDQAGLYAADERITSLESHDYSTRIETLERRGFALEQAHRQTGILFNLFDTSRHLRLTERGLNTFLTGVMEGRIARGAGTVQRFSHISRAWIFRGRGGLR